MKHEIAILAYAGSQLHGKGKAPIHDFNGGCANPAFTDRFQSVDQGSRGGVKDKAPAGDGRRGKARGVHLDELGLPAVRIDHGERGVLMVAGPARSCRLVGVREGGADHLGKRAVSRGCRQSVVHHLARG